MMKAVSINSISYDYYCPHRLHIQYIDNLSFHYLLICIPTMHSHMYVHIDTERFSPLSHFSLITKVSHISALLVKRLHEYEVTADNEIIFKSLQEMALP